MVAEVVTTIEETTEVIEEVAETVTETVVQYVGYDYTDTLNAITTKLDVIDAKLDSLLTVGQNILNALVEFGNNNLSVLHIVGGVLLFFTFAFVFFLCVRLFKMFF